MKREESWDASDVKILVCRLCVLMSESSLKLGWDRCGWFAVYIFMKRKNQYHGIPIRKHLGL